MKSAREIAKTNEMLAAEIDNTYTIADSMRDTLDQLCAEDVHYNVSLQDYEENINIAIKKTRALLSYLEREALFFDEHYEELEQEGTEAKTCISEH